MDDFILIAATNLRPGHVFPNGGEVQSVHPSSGQPTRVGSFVVVPVKTSRWSLATGTHVDVTEDLVLHASDEVYVQVPAQEQHQDLVAITDTMKPKDAALSCAWNLTADIAPERRFDRAALYVTAMLGCSLREARDVLRTYLNSRP